jgi:hypothetical protein
VEVACKTQEFGGMGITSICFAFRGLLDFLKVGHGRRFLPVVVASSCDKWRAVKAQFCY